MRTLFSLLLSAALAAPAAAQGTCEVIGIQTDEVAPPAVDGPLSFDVSFGASVTFAQRAVINEALSEWTGLVTTGGHIANPFPVIFVNGPLGGSRLAQAQTSWDGSGTLVTSTITIDNDGSSTFFVDPTPNTNVEFDANGNCVDPACMGVSDLLSVMRHEIGHAIGWTGAYGTNQNPLTAAYVSGLTFDAGRLNIALDPAFTSHSDPAVHPGDLMNPALPGGTRIGISWYPTVALPARNIDHDVVLKFIDAGSTSLFAFGTADLPWKSVASAVSVAAPGARFLMIPGTYDENPFTIVEAHDFYLARGGSVLIQ